MLLPLHPEALEELDAAVAYLERERRGAGAHLFDEVRLRLEQASLFPGSGKPILGFAERFDVRSYLILQYRYQVIVALIHGERTVIALAHTSRDPGYWRHRLKG